MSMVIGVDTGLKGACVALIDGEPQRDSVVRAKTYEVVTTSVSTTRLDVNALHDDLAQFCPLHDVTIFMEDPNMTPNMLKKNGGARLKTQFETIGKFKAVFELMGDPRIVTILPHMWKDKYGLTKIKDKTKNRAAVERVHGMFPDFGELLVGEADIAEAVLIGRYGWKYLNI